MKRIAAAVAALALLAAGCGVDKETDQPAATPAPHASSDEPSTAESTTSTPKGPVDTASAEEALEAWFQFAGETMSGGNPPEPSSVTDECLDCRSFVDNIAVIYRNGGSITDGSEAVAELRFGELADGLSTYRVRTTHEESVIKESDDSTPRNLESGEGFYEFDLAMANEGVVIAGFRSTAPW